MQHDALALFLHFSLALFFGTLFHHLLDLLLLCTLSGKSCRNISESLLLGQDRPVGFPNKTTITTTTTSNTLRSPQSFASVNWRARESPKQTIEPSFSSKKWIKLIPKTIGNRKKRLCVRLRSGDRHHLRKSADRKAQIRKVSVALTGLICAVRSVDFLRWCLHPERNLTHNLFFYFQMFLVLISLL